MIKWQVPARKCLLWNRKLPVDVIVKVVAGRDGDFFCPLVSLKPSHIDFLINLAIKLYK
jgi:hypothetical protein